LRSKTVCALTPRRKCCCAVCAKFSRFFAKSREGFRGAIPLFHFNGKGVSASRNFRDFSRKTRGISQFLRNFRDFSKNCKNREGFRRAMPLFHFNEKGVSALLNFRDFPRFFGKREEFRNFYGKSSIFKGASALFKNRGFSRKIARNFAEIEIFAIFRKIIKLRKSRNFAKIVKK